MLASSMKVKSNVYTSTTRKMSTDHVETTEAKSAPKTLNDRFAVLGRKLIEFAKKRPLITAYLSLSTISYLYVHWHNKEDETYMDTISQRMDISSYNEAKDTLKVTRLNKTLENYSKSFENAIPGAKKPRVPQSGQPIERKRSVYVLSFTGDLQASQVAKFRREVTAVICNADPTKGDSVVILVKSGGGTVSGYGLAAAQMERIKKSGLGLVVCVDEVAASGGYLMASVADKIVAAPFAQLGSIGVIMIAPNFSERLKREGIEVDDITAGKYKRTLVPYKPATEESRKKLQSDAEDIHKIFRDFVSRNRPGLAIDDVATGEVWLGTEALKKGLCDELSTSDDYILHLMQSGIDVYGISFEPKQKGLKALFDTSQNKDFINAYDNESDCTSQSTSLREDVTNILSAFSYLYYAVVAFGAMMNTNQSMKSIGFSSSGILNNDIKAQLGEYGNLADVMKNGNISDENHFPSLIYQDNKRI